MKASLFYPIAAFFMVSSIVEADEPLSFPQLLEFQEVKVHEVHPDSITILHKTGGATIPYERLPKEL